MTRAQANDTISLWASKIKIENSFRKKNDCPHYKKLHRNPKTKRRKGAADDMAAAPALPGTCSRKAEDDVGVTFALSRLFPHRPEPTSAELGTKI